MVKFNGFLVVCSPITVVFILWQSWMLVSEDSTSPAAPTPTPTPTIPGGMTAASTAKGFQPSIAVPKGYTTEPRWMKGFKKVEGPARNDQYNPHYGYEPYWKGGDWVFQFVNNTENGSMCDKPCSPMYIMYGKICAGNLAGENKTFDTYCDMVSADCSRKQFWSILYRGECQGEMPTLAWNFEDDGAAQLKTRASDWIWAYFNRTLTTISARKQKEVERFLAKQKKLEEEKRKAAAAKNSTKPGRGPQGKNT